MVCDKCGVDTNYYKTIKQSDKLEYVCLSCYEQHEQQNEFHIGSFFDSMNQEDMNQIKHVDACPVCGATMEDFKKTGLLGCGECYTHFISELLPFIQQMQGSTHYMGKHLNVTQSILERQKEEIEEQIRECVLKEDYEKAAQLKKQLDALKEND